MKGIILAGGHGTRLHPMTLSISKQLLPVFDKPMIYYPLSTLMLLGIKDILLITTSRDISRFKQLLGNGEHLGIKISYALQDIPRGLAEALLIGEDFIQNDQVALILGDNIFIGEDFYRHIPKKITKRGEAVILGYQIRDARPYGVINYDGEGRIVSLEEKPRKPVSQFIIPGLYFYDGEVVKIAQRIVPSERGELEITSVNQEYLKLGKLKVLQLPKNVTWFDVGDFQSLNKASEFIENAQKNTGSYIACVEEIAYRMGYISKEQLRENADRNKMTDYGDYLNKLVQDYKNIEEESKEMGSLGFVKGCNGAE